MWDRSIVMVRARRRKQKGDEDYRGGSADSMTKDGSKPRETLSRLIQLPIQGTQQSLITCYGCHRSASLSTKLFMYLNAVHSLIRTRIERTSGAVSAVIAHDASLRVFYY